VCRQAQVRAWDLAAQRCVGRVATGSGSAKPFVTSLPASAWPGTDLLVVGLSNGHIATSSTCPPRVPGTPFAPSWGRAAVVASLREPKRWVVNVAQARGGSAYSLVSAPVNADVRFWDLRRSTSSCSVQAHRGAMTALAVHELSPAPLYRDRLSASTGEPLILDVM